MEFEWDAAKARSNLEKHGLAFETAALAFLDPRCVAVEDGRFDYGERRFVIFGRIAGRLCAVVYTEDAALGVVRIISARKANRKERRLYEQG